MCRRLVVHGLWLAITPVGWLLANKRYAVVAPVLQPFEERLRADNHRSGHALCVPLPFSSHWLVRCHGCHAWTHLREVPALGGRGVDLKVVHGTLDRVGSCAARYLGAPHPAPAPQVAPDAGATTDPSQP